MYRIRRFFYSFGYLKREVFKVPIISIGNLTFGGTGKTPFTLWVSEYMASKNKKVMILMRGYKGSLEHFSGILRSDGRLGFNPAEYGDEALLLARRLKNASVVVGKNRAENLDFYFDEEKPDVVLLDDGHQHLQLQRRMNIVLFDCLMPLANYKVAPQGYMREGFSALKSAEVIVLGRADQVDLEKIASLKKLITPHLSPGVAFAEIKYIPVGFYDIHYHMAFDLNDIRGKKVICVAGIASPNSFFSLAESLGAEILEQKAFPDHHQFKLDELTTLCERAEKNDCIILTTEKDMVKMRRIHDSSNIVYLEIKVEFIRGEEKVKEIISNCILN
ncbi:MAG: tetraacyldisaccharide 4'-kinase [Halobacteriovoraceae bacterium]|nr:tetraacyldisaccharide 4'-kinase [Halobacteriovoraceae bacterium]MBT5096004.1 tetraacyldisaccharide 4'-kinase [Halobacteriovoraceae bacterium]